MRRLPKIFLRTPIFARLRSFHTALYGECRVKHYCIRLFSCGRGAFWLIRGEPAVGRVSRRNLVFGWSVWTRTMKHHSLQRRAPRRRAHSGYGFEAMAVFGSPPPRIMIGGLCANARRTPKLSVIPLLFVQIVQATAVRKVTPTGISPIVAIRHRAMRSFRPSATIIVVSRLPTAPSVRARYDCPRV